MSGEARRMYTGNTTKHLKLYKLCQHERLVLVRINMSLPLYGQQNVISPKCVLEKSNTPHSVSSMIIKLFLLWILVRITD